MTTAALFPPAVSPQPIPAQPAVNVAAGRRTRVLILAGGYSGDTATVLERRADGALKLETDSWVLLYWYPAAAVKEL